MSLFDNPDQMRLLQNLLYPPECKRNSDSETDDEAEYLVRRKSASSIDQTNIQNKESLKSLKKTFKSPYAPAKDIDKPDAAPKTLEEWEKQQEQEESLLDGRKCPEYSMTYKQAVGTEDIFLQMGNRTSSTASCEDLVLEIHLTDEIITADKMNLSLTENEIDLSTPIYRLKLPLAHKINVDRCRAKYDTDTHKLTLTLRLQRELDFINF